MARKRKNGEGSWGTKTIKGTKYKYYRDKDGFIFPASWTYSNYQNSKRGIGRRWLWWW